MAAFSPYISEIRFLGGASTDFVEIALDSGEDPSNISVVIYHPNGTVRSTNALSATPDATIAGSDIYTVMNGVHKNGAVALVVDGDVVAFLSFHATLTANGGAADGMTSTALGTNASGESFVSTDHGASYAVDTSPDPGVIPCFLAGTRLKTPCGPVPAEKLSAGDVVWTVDNGPQRIVWAGQRALRPAETVCGDFFPVCIPKGALGPHSPHRDLYLSPNHRVHLANAAYELLFGSNEALLPARRLVGHNGIHFARDILAPVYVHLLFERHELVVSNGLVSESFHPRPLGLSGFAHETRAELLTLFPDLGQRPDAYGPTTRPCLDRQEAAVALAYLPEAA